jgi:hypothetical protein
LKPSGPSDLCDGKFATILSISSIVNGFTRWPRSSTGSSSSLRSK